jgi:heptosyltransferase-1
MKILIIKTSSLGDIIHAFQTLDYLRHKNPEARIDWVVEKEFSELLKAHPAIDHVLCVETKKWRKALFQKKTWQEIQAFRTSLRSISYDVVFDLQGNIKSGVIGSQVVAKNKVGFGPSSVAEWPNLFFTQYRYNFPKQRNIREDYLYLAQSFFNDPVFFTEKEFLFKITDEQQRKIDEILKNPLLENRSKIMVCPGSAWPNKQMASHALEDMLSRLGAYVPCCFLFVWGNPTEKEFVSTLAAKFPDKALIVDKLPLPVLQNLMDKMDRVIAMDSLPLHLAGTTSVSTLSIFGASSSDKYKPRGEKHLSIQGSCPYHHRFEKRCSILRSCQTGACIRQLKTEQVVNEKTIAWLKGKEYVEIKKEEGV